MSAVPIIGTEVLAADAYQRHLKAHGARYRADKGKAGEQLFHVPRSGRWARVKSIGDGKVRLDWFASCPCLNG